MSLVKVQRNSDGIMRVEYPRHAIIGIDEVKDEYNQRLALAREKTPLLVMIHGMSLFSDEAQEFLCGSENSAITSAAAIVRDVGAGYFEHSKVLMNLFKIAKKPLFNIEVFETEDAANKWLKSYL